MTYNIGTAFVSSLINETQQTSSYTLTINDANTAVEMNSASPVTVTVPTNATVGYPIGTTIEIYQMGAGMVTLSPAAGVTIRSTGLLSTQAQFASLRLRHRGTDEWVLSGNLNSTILSASSFLPSGHTFGLQISSAPATLAAYYGTLGAAQAVFSFATALTNYVDRCVVQLALNRCTANGGGIVLLPIAAVYLDTTVTWDASQTTLSGTSNQSGVKTNLRTQTCGSSPALAFSGGTGTVLQSGNPALMNLDLYGKNAGITSFPQSGSGVANTGYRSGAIALQISASQKGIGAQNVGFYNFDTPHSWSGSNIFAIDFINCYYFSNNYGICIGTTSTPATQNAIERMRWSGGSSSNNNYGFVFNMGTNSGSLFVEDMSFDYNIVRSGWYDGLAGGSDCQIPLYLSNIHQESNGTTSGYTVCPFFNNGALFFTNVHSYWNDGTNPIGWVEAAFYASTKFVNCTIPGTGSTVPAVYNSGGTQGFVTASGLNMRYYSNYIQLLKTSNGIAMYGGRPGASNSQSGSFTVDLTHQAILNILTSGGTITVPPDSTTNQYIGATIQFVTADTTNWTLAPGAGVTLSSAGGLTFGGNVGSVIQLIKVAANTWAVGAFTTFGGSVKSAGSNTPRTLADRSDDIINVLDWLTAGQPDGTTDNTSQLQAAINAGAGVATVYFPPTASNYIHTGLTVPSNSHLVIDGYLLTKSTVSSATSYLISTATGASNLVIEGHGTLDGNKAALTTPGQGGVRPNQATNVIIRGLTVKNTFRSGVFPSGCTNCLLEDLTILNTGNSNGFSGAGQNGAGAVISTNCWARNCHVDATQDLGFGFYDGATNSGITDCLVTNNALGNPGIFVMTDGGTFASSNIVIENNVIQGIVGSAGDGVSVYVANVSLTHTNITIANNQLSIIRGNGVNLANCSYVSITDNMIVNGGNMGISLAATVANYRITGNTIDKAQGTGINLVGCANGSITDNNISDVQNGTPTGLVLTSACSNTYIAHNNFFDNQGTPTMANGITSSSNPGTGAVFFGNKFTNVATPYSFTNSSDTILVKYGSSAAGAVDFITNVTAPTQSPGDNTTKVATTAFVTAAGGSTPAYCYVYLHASQSVTGSSITKVLFDTISFDTLSSYDATTNHRYTPNRAGKYLVTLQVYTQTATGSTTVTNTAYVYKNGTAYAHGGNQPYNTNPENENITCTTIVSMNGTTDYLEGYGMVSGTGSTVILPDSSGITTSMIFQWLGT